MSEWQFRSLREQKFSIAPPPCNLTRASRCTPLPDTSRATWSPHWHRMWLHYAIWNPTAIWSEDPSSSSLTLMDTILSSPSLTLMIIIKLKERTQVVKPQLITEDPRDYSGLLPACLFSPSLRVHLESETQSGSRYLSWDTVWEGVMEDSQGKSSRTLGKANTF